MTLDELLQTWRADAVVLKQHGQLEYAETLEGYAEQVEHARSVEAVALVTVPDAARVAGVHEDTIRRWIRAGRLHNHAPSGEAAMIRRGELPTKPATPNGTNEGGVRPCR